MGPDDDTEELRQQREHHYVFAHRVLAGAVLGDPERFVAGVMSGAPMLERLQTLWDDMREHVTIPMDHDGLDVRLAPFRGEPVPVVVFPEPAVAPEAHFVAVIPAPQRWLDRVLRRPRQWRYMTLEFSRRLDGSRTTVLGEWAFDQGMLHRNFGSGPEPSVPAFLAALESLGGSVAQSRPR